MRYFILRSLFERRFFMSITFELRYVYAGYNITQLTFFIMRRFISLLSVLMLVAPMAPITHAE